MTFGVTDNARPLLAALGSRAFRCRSGEICCLAARLSGILPLVVAPETGHSRTEKARLNSFAISLCAKDGAKDALLEVRKKAAVVVAVARPKPRGISKNPHWTGVGRLWTCISRFGHQQRIMCRGPSSVRRSAPL